MNIDRRSFLAASIASLTASQARGFTVPTTLLQTSMANLSSIQAPLAGTGIGHQFVTSPVNNFVDGGVRFNSKDDYLSYPEQSGIVQHYAPAAGSLEFDFRPRWKPTDTEKLSFLTRRAWTAPPGPGLFEWGLHNLSNARRMRLISVDAAGVRSDQTIERPDWEPHFTQNVWRRVRITWDWNVPVGVQCVHIYSNGTEIPITRWEVNLVVQPGIPTLTGPHSFVGLDPAHDIYIGNRGPGSNYRANADIRNFVSEAA